MKSGGTTISDLLRKTIGHVYPGSREDSGFVFKEAQDAIKKGVDMSTFRVSFAHAIARPTMGPETTKVAKIFQSTLSQRRLRLLTMIREPLALRASHVAMWVCAYNAYLRMENQQQGTPKNCQANLTALMDLKATHFIENICPKFRTGPPGVSGIQKHWCSRLEQGVDPFAKCRSISALLGSKSYDKYLHDLYRPIMGRYIREDTRNDSRELVVDQVEEYALEDLGGLDPSPNQPEADFIWFGITERMHESTCLFFYTFRVTATEIPQHRVQNCRPTDWWSEEEKEVVRERELVDYAVFRAANAILDVRLLKMRNDIQFMLDTGATLEDMPHVGPGCFEATGP